MIGSTPVILLGLGSVLVLSVGIVEVLAILSLVLESVFPLPGDVICSWLEGMSVNSMYCSVSLSWVRISALLEVSLPVGL